MPVNQIAVERFSAVSAKPLADVLAAVDAVIGHPDLGEMQREVAASKTYAEMEAVIHKVVGTTGLMEFLRLDMGMYLAKGRPGATPRSVRMLVGNPLIMRRMAEHVPDTASYAPVTILIDERADGVHSLVRQDGEFSGFLRERGGLRRGGRTRPQGRSDADGGRGLAPAPFGVWNGRVRERNAGILRCAQNDKRVVLMTSRWS